MKTKLLVSLMIAIMAAPLRADSPAAAIVDKYPARTLADDIASATTLLKLGPDAIREVTKLIVPLGTGDDTKARYALAGITRHVMRDGGEADRKAYVAVLIEALTASKDVEVKTFFMHELLQCGRGDAVAAIAPLLSEPELCDPAAMTLQRIGTESSRKALAAALPAATGAQRVTLVKICGSANVGEAAEEILKSATSSDAKLRMTALQSLGELGAPPAAAEVLKKATEAAAPLERAQATAYYIAFAWRIGKNGSPKGAEICRDVIKTRIAPDEANVRSAALAALVSSAGEGALPDLLAAANSSEIELRMAALNFAQSLPAGPQITERFVQLMNESPVSDIRIDVLRMLVRRGDKSAAPGVLALLGDKDAKVVQAAIPAAAKLAGDEAIAALIDVMRGVDADETATASEALARMPGPHAMAAVAGALDGGKSPAATIAMLKLLGSRGAAGAAILRMTSGQSPEIRLAAIKALATAGTPPEADALRAMFETLPNAQIKEAALASAVAIAQGIPDSEQRAAGFLQTMQHVKGADLAAVVAALPRLGGAGALAAVKAQASSDDKAVKDAAIRALADWPDSTALQPLLQIANAESDTTLQVIAIRGVIHGISLSQAPLSERAAAYSAAMSAAKRPEEKRLLLAALANDGWGEVLPIAAAALDDPAIKLDAARAVIKLVVPRGKRTAGLRGPAAASALEKAAKIATDPSEREDAEKYLKTIKGK